MKPCGCGAPSPCSDPMHGAKIAAMADVSAQIDALTVLRHVIAHGSPRHLALAVASIHQQSDALNARTAALYTALGGTREVRAEAIRALYEDMWGTATVVLAREYGIDLDAGRAA